MTQKRPKTYQNDPKCPKMPWNEPKTAKNASKWPKMAQKSTKTHFIFSIELNCPRIILNWIFYWIELAQNNFELNIFFELNPDNFFWIGNWIESFLTVFFWIKNWIESFSTVFFWIKNWIESFSTVFFWIKNWIESFSSEIQSLIESSNCTSQGYLLWRYIGK